MGMLSGAHPVLAARNRANAAGHRGDGGPLGAVCELGPDIRKIGLIVKIADVAQFLCHRLSALVANGLVAMANGDSFLCLSAGPHSSLHRAQCSLEGAVVQHRSPMSQFGKERCGKAADVIGQSCCVCRQGARNRGFCHHSSMWCAGHCSHHAVASEAPPISDLHEHGHFSRYH